MKLLLLTSVIISLNCASAEEPIAHDDGVIYSITGGTPEQAIETYKKRRAEKDEIDNLKKEAEEKAKIAAMDEPTRLLYLQKKEERRRSSEDSDRQWAIELQKMHEDTVWLAANASSLPPEEAIPRLAAKITGTIASTKNNATVMSEYYLQLRDTIYRIPGHAEYFSDVLNSILDKFIDDRNKSRSTYGPDYDSYDSKRHDVFCKLGCMQTPEAVRVLGDMFDDMREIHPFPNQYQGANAAPNAILALLVLRDSLHVSGLPSAPLTFEHMPYNEIVKTPLKELFEADLAPWREWYAELKAGKRTYHFEDSETEYNWDGSLAKKIALRKDHKPSGETANNSSSIAKPAASIIHPSEERNDNWLVIMASTIAGILLLIAGWKSFIKPRLS